MRDTAKGILRVIFLVLNVPILLSFFLGCIFFDEDRVFKSHSELIALLPGRFGVYYRAAFYSTVCPNTSSDIVIGFLTVLSHRRTEIEPGVYIGPQGNIGLCRIGENCLLGSSVHILSGKNQHSFDVMDVPIKFQKSVYTKIEVSKDCWIGNGALVLADLGTRSVVAAGAVVTKSFGDEVVLGGNPASVLRSLSDVNFVEDA